jgi:hypothetical protein
VWGSIEWGGTGWRGLRLRRRRANLEEVGDMRKAACRQGVEELSRRSRPFGRRPVSDIEVFFFVFFFLNENGLLLYMTYCEHFIVQENTH